MSGLRDAVLWVAAVGIALVVWRLRRGRLLVGRLSPRLVRMVAVVLVALGVGPGEAAGAEPDPEACRTLPEGSPAVSGAQDVPLAGVVPAAIATPGEAQRTFVVTRLAREGAWARSKQALDALEQSPSDALTDEAKAALARLDVGGIARPPLNLVAREWTALVEGAPSVERLLAALDATEAAGTYDGWVVGALFRRSASAARDLKAADGAALATLYGRLEGHARVDDAALKALAVVGPVEQRPWMSKAMRPMELRGFPDLVPPPTLGAELKKAFPAATAGTWRTEATLPLRVTSAPSGAVLLRRGESLKLKAGALVVLGRLDVLVVPAGGPLVLEHARLGAITVPPDRAVTAWDLPSLLGPEAQATVAKWIADAATCDTAAQRSLRLALPATHEALRSAGDSKGAPAMRLILALFDR
ncbi:MAG: hypothetical protein AMXMBFR64_42000 [Myxococcales bacterium]